MRRCSRPSGRATTRRRACARGNDVGTQYRSGIYVADAGQRAVAERSRDDYQQALAARGYGPITTEILDAPPFYFAEDYHQQYLAKNPAGYCGLGGTGVSMPDRGGRRGRLSGLKASRPRGRCGPRWPVRGGDDGGRER